MKMEDAIEKAAKELPPNCHLLVFVENGSASIQVVNDGVLMDLDVDTADMSLTEELLTCLRKCRCACQSTESYDIGYHWVKFYNHHDMKIMYWNGSQFESFISDFAHDEIEYVGNRIT